MKHYPCGDLHCDLLLYLAGGPPRTAFDPDARCSVPYLKEGGVVFQTLAVYTETAPGSTASAAKQISIFKTHIQEFPEIAWMPAIENGSGVIEEGEKLELGLERLARWQRELKNILYLSLTWNTENRLGGGNFSTVGLKRDGEIFLEKLAELGICIDMSHTSDALAHDILNYIDKKGLKLRPIASHSNFRKFCDMRRNLPDEIAREIFKRGGVIGMNFVRKFVGPDFLPDLRRHIEHGIALGGERQLCFGADFFCTTDSPSKDLEPYFMEGYGNASCYQKVLRELGLPVPFLEGLSSKNLFAFLQVSK